MNDNNKTPSEKIVALLGEDVFLVPCEWGTKEPLVTYVERPFEDGVGGDDAADACRYLVHQPLRGGRQAKLVGF